MTAIWYRGFRTRIAIYLVLIATVVVGEFGLQLFDVSRCGGTDACVAQHRSVPRLLETAAGMALLASPLFLVKGIDRLAERHRARRLDRLSTTDEPSEADE
jgi:hypothetical protein